MYLFLKNQSQSYITKLNQKVISCVKTEKLDQGIFEMTEKILDNYDAIAKKDDKSIGLNINVNPTNNYHSSLNKDKRVKDLKENELNNKNNNIGSKPGAKINNLTREKLFSEKFYSKNNKMEDGKIILNQKRKITLTKVL